MLFSHVFYVEIDQRGVITLPLLLSRCCHYTYLLSEMCIILVSTSRQRYHPFHLMLEHAVLISTYVQHYHRDLAKDSYYLTERAWRSCGDLTRNTQDANSTFLRKTSKRIYSAYQSSPKETLQIV